MRPARALAVAALAVAILPGLVRADDPGAVDALNAPSKVVQDKSKSWKGLFDAYLAMTAPPQKVGADFNVLSVWPGMKGWAEVSAWAAANPGMGAALLEAQGKVTFALPYGRSNVPPGYVEKGVYLSIGDGLSVHKAEAGYLKALATIDTWVAAEMYRLGEEKKFDEAFSLGVATLRVLRQVADQHLLEEKAFAMQAMCDVASLQRDVLQTFLDQVPAAVARKYALTGYSQIRGSDGERLRRLEMPEGDRVLAEALIAQLFDAQGQADAAKFVPTLSELQASREPLSRFGAARRWAEIAEVHGSLDATRIRLTSIYDDWWRRWRARYYDTILDNPTVISRTNKMRYAMVLAMGGDLERLFALRQRLNAELNGTVLAFGVAAYYRDSGEWPGGVDRTYGVSTPKRFDADPWDPQFGRWQYEKLPAPKGVDTEGGRVEVPGCIIYARGVDKQDGGASKVTGDGLTGDFVAWPSLRVLARGGK